MHFLDLKIPGIGFDAGRCPVLSGFQEESALHQTVDRAGSDLKMAPAPRNPTMANKCLMTVGPKFPDRLILVNVDYATF